LEESRVNFDEVSKSVVALTELNMDYLRKEDLNLIWERLDTKSDKLELAQI